MTNRLRQQKKKNLKKIGCLQGKALRTFHLYEEKSYDINILYEIDTVNC